jgi:hypothetical protein
MTSIGRWNCLQRASAFVRMARMYPQVRYHSRFGSVRLRRLTRALAHCWRTYRDASHGKMKSLPAILIGLVAYFGVGVSTGRGQVMYAPEPTAIAPATPPLAAAPVELDLQPALRVSGLRRQERRAFEIDNRVKNQSNAANETLLTPSHFCPYFASPVLGVDIRGKVESRRWRAYRWPRRWAYR